jgi:DNA-binding NarL/FixJ family response regulator
MERKKVVIVDDHTMLSEGLRSLLVSNGGFEVVGEAANGAEIVQCVQNHKPDLVLVDIATPKIDGPQAIKEIKRRFPEVKILVLTVHKSADYVLEAFQSGANGYCLKNATYADLVAAMKSVLSGKPCVCPGVPERVLEEYLEGGKNLKPKPVSPWDTLTQREKGVLKLISEGYTNKQIAGYLGISAKTVDKHRSNLMRKLDLHKASALTAYAIERGLLEK